MDLVNKINRSYVKIANKITPQYERVMGLPCDIYLPIFNEYTSEGLYKDVKVYAPHQSPTYKSTPDFENIHFYIPFLIKKDAMNSSESEFDSFYTADEIDRPFIETSKKRELPLQTKVVVKQGKSIMKFFVDKKLAVTGADGFMLLRMYLSPLAKDNDNTEVQEEVVTENDNSGSSVLGSSLDGSSNIQMNIPD